MSFLAQAYSKAWAQTGSPRASASLMSGAAEAVLLGVVKCRPWSVRTGWTLYGTALIRAARKSAATRGVAFSCSSTKEALLGPDLCDVDVEVADRIAFEL